MHTSSAKIKTVPNFLKVIGYQKFNLSTTYYDRIDLVGGSDEKYFDRDHDARTVGSEVHNDHEQTILLYYPA